jgi:hypothetical protein
VSTSLFVIPHQRHASANEIVLYTRDIAFFPFCCPFIGKLHVHLRIPWSSIAHLNKTLQRCCRLSEALWPSRLVLNILQTRSSGKKIFDTYSYISYDKDHVDNYASNNSSIFTCVFGEEENFLLSLCLATEERSLYLILWRSPPHTSQSSSSKPSLAA